MIRWLTAVIISLMSLDASAVDGYKDLKFGTSKVEIQKRKICSFSASPDATDSTLSCTDFNFGGKKRMAFAYFLDGKFQRFAIAIDIAEVVGIANGLKDKYGPASSMSTKEEFSTVDTSPGSEASIKFDNDTIIIKMTNDESYGKFGMLIYTDADYERSYYDKQSTSLKDDL
ncbi:hypothetical protein [Aeromonas sp.]|jgi:hypothetical protein|uniref:hypothetical protein n=1 Tax=Aeromonas sp. TaxID=647 RepID=UPI00258EB337|nr:hypothetical protein [Aeromonas sp.]MCX7134381.1 hypothetical protein [Aeromonas sp.]